MNKLPMTSKQVDAFFFIAHYLHSLPTTVCKWILNVVSGRIMTDGLDTIHFFLIQPM